MSLFDSVLSVVSSQVQQHGGMASVIGGLLANNSEHGGLNGLVEKFTQAGMGNVVNSWIGSGQNMPISGDQLASVLGNGTVANIARTRLICPQQSESLPTNAIDSPYPTAIPMT